MIVANFFDRNVAAVMQVLKGVDPAAFKERLSGIAVALAFDRAAASSTEGTVTLELALDLLARLYPGICLLPQDSDTVTLALAGRLSKAAKKIHPRVSLDAKPGAIKACLVVGERTPDLHVPAIFIGSRGWTALLNRTEAIGSLSSGNPFGAAAAACIGVANVFRIVFASDLTDAAPDERVKMDILHHRLQRCLAAPGLPRGLDLGQTHLVGLGAIGRAACWTLARVPTLAGELHGIDHETIDRTNLQRYVASTQQDHEKFRQKTASVATMFEGTSVNFVGHPEKWGQYLRGRGSFELGRVAVALDTAGDRIAVQASLPRRLLNAWTQPGDLGVSRHDFIDGACLACLYLPDGATKSFSQNVADALQLDEMEIRTLLHINFKVDHPFLQRVSDATGVSMENLKPFERMPLESFYSKAVCGTTHFGSVRSGARGAVAVPMAFQSALAGVLLAAEIVSDILPIRTLDMRPVTKINLLKPLGSYLGDPAVKHPSGRCLCQDEAYVSAYRRKHLEIAA